MVELKKEEDYISLEIYLRLTDNKYINNLEVFNKYTGLYYTIVSRVEPEIYICKKCIISEEGNIDNYVVCYESSLSVFCNICLYENVINSTKFIKQQTLFESDIVESDIVKDLEYVSSTLNAIPNIIKEDL